MLKRSFVAIVVFVSLGAAAGCGGGGESSPPLTKAEFQKQAEKICTKVHEARNTAISKFQEAQSKAGEKPQSKAGLDKAVSEVLAPSVREELEELEALNPPAKDKAKVEAMLQRLSDGLAKLEAGGYGVVEKTNIFQKYQEEATAYGIEACGP